MKNNIIFTLSFLVTTSFFWCCNAVPEPMLEQHFSLEEVKAVAAKYGMADVVTMEKNGGLRFLTAEQLEDYFADERRIRDYRKQDSLYEASITSIRSFADYEQLIKSIPGREQRERESFEKSNLGITYDQYMAGMRNVNWHIYLVENKNAPSSLHWVKPADDDGQVEGLRLDKAK